MIGASLTFPLVSRRRLLGLAFGTMHGARRGTGSDIAGSRPYRSGDDPHRIDWGSSARLSAARGTEEFLVREYLADEAPRVVCCVDRRPSMGLARFELPFLHKDVAASVARSVIEDSVAESRGLIGCLEFGEHATSVDWCPPASGRRSAPLIPYEVPPRESDGVTAALEFLAIHRRAVPSASFVFVLSDFLEQPHVEAWDAALDRGWDVVPVVIQDPIWEQGFPDVDRLVVPLASEDGRIRPVRLRLGESERCRARHEERLARFVEDVRSVGIEPVLVSDEERDHVFGRFLDWSAERQAAWGHAA